MAYTDLSALLETATDPTAEPEPAPTRRRKPTRARRLATSADAGADADAGAEPAPAEHPTQTAIRTLLNGIGEGLTMRELGQAIDVSRQTGLYHAKRLVARNEVVRGCGRGTGDALRTGADADGILPAVTAPLNGRSHP